MFVCLCPDVHMYVCCVGVCYLIMCVSVHVFKVIMNSFSPSHYDGELFQNMNTRVPSEPRYNLRKRSHPQQQQETIFLLTHEFEKLTIH